MKSWRYEFKLSHLILFAMLVMFALALTGCDGLFSRWSKKNPDDASRSGTPAQQMLSEVLNAQTPTCVYILVSDGKFRFFANSIGYGLPAGAHYNNPQEMNSKDEKNSVVIAATEINGVYMPTSAEGRFIKIQNPKTKEWDNVYFNGSILISPFKLPNKLCVR